MTLTFFTNLVHHHQTPVADEFYGILGDDYRYVAMFPLPDFLIRGGYDPNIKRPYILRAYDSEDSKKEAERLMLESDVVIHSYGFEDLLRKRKALNKITFDYSERWLKTHLVKSFLPRNLLRVYKNYFSFRNKRDYLLCASAFAARDAGKFFCFPHKCFKWGYFTCVDTPPADDTCRDQITGRNNTRILWCARFLPWKHPEMVIELATELKHRGYEFSIDMYGSGEKLEETKALAITKNISDIVHFPGNLPNAEMVKKMREYDIFLFTSDRNEGWGAVLNETMSQGCVPVAADEIGSVPYLISEQNNGLIFKSGDTESLVSKVTWLLEHPEEMIIMSQNAASTIRDTWSPQNAAKRFLELVQYVQEDNLSNYLNDNGPASWAA